jgi:hypothetical protein
MSWLKKLFKSKPQPQPQPEIIREIVHIPYETLVLKARISEPEMPRYAIVDSNYAMNQVKSQLAMELLEQIVNQDLIKFENIQDFGHNIVEATILVLIKK